MVTRCIQIIDDLFLMFNRKFAAKIINKRLMSGREKFVRITLATMAVAPENLCFLHNMTAFPGP